MNTMNIIRKVHRTPVASLVLATIASCVVFGALSGCTASTESVQNNPPSFDDNVVKISSVYGSVSADSVVIFLWPEGLNRQQLAAEAKIVNRASDDLDEFSLKQYRKTQLEDAFGQAQCKDKYGVFGPTDDPLADWVPSWKTADLTVPGQAAEIQRCRDNQEQRRMLAHQLDGQNPGDFINTIFKTVDPGYPDHVVNNKVPDPQTVINRPWTIAIVPNSTAGKPTVEITAPDFVVTGYSPSTKPGSVDLILDAAYDSKTRLLTFSFADPELNRSGDWQKEFYHFKLERAADFGGKARFRGDVTVVKKGSVVRIGMAKIEGNVK